MRVFVAGATGALGRPVVRRLVAAGHEVVGLTRSRERAEDLLAAGAVPAVADALDAQEIRAAVLAARPEAVLHLLTDLAGRSLRRPSDFAPTNALRTTGTRYLLDAASLARAPRRAARGGALRDAPGVSCERARRELGWAPLRPSWRDGVRALGAAR